MTREKSTAEIGVALKAAPSGSVDAGSEVSLSATLDWPERIPKDGARLLLSEGDRALREAAPPEASADGSVLFTRRAPDEVGDHGLTLVISSEKREAEGTLSFSLATVPHATSLAVWDVPSPVVRDAAFEITAGAKCSSACTLAGK